ncbi:hypothetical protein N9651_02620 [Flavobacteriales bacterium]|nr:hypothetical protein [Flavobacteriales bacterium]
MKKLITVSLLLICVSISFSQSKKQQIETLTIKLDSVNSVLLRSIDSNRELNTTKIALESKISLLKKENASKDEEIESLKVYNKSLSTELNLKSDSLRILKIDSAFTAFLFEKDFKWKEVLNQNNWFEIKSKVSGWDGSEQFSIFQLRFNSNIKIIEYIISGEIGGISEYFFLKGDNLVLSH